MLAETLLAGAGALVVLAVVFGSLVAITPLLIATVAIPSAFVFIYALTYAITVSTLVQNIVALVGLGVAIDYALLIVTRWREERGRGLDNRAAVLRASATAGTSVLFSGITVAVSLAALALTSVPFLRSIGLAAMLIPLISIAVSATLLPVVLDAAGPALEWPRRQPARTLSPLWTAIARRVTARPGWSAAGALAILAVLIAPVFSLNLGEPQATATAATATASARAGLDALVTSGIGPGVLRPAEILLPAGRAVPAPGGPITVVSPAAWTRDGLHIVNAWSPADPSSPAGKAALAEIKAAAAAVPGARTGGSPAQDADFITALYGPNLAVIIAAIAVVTFVLLARALRSLWLPVKALLLNLVSLAAAFGVLVFIWQHGHGTTTLFSSPATGAITLWVPLAVFALLFGLSMDYEVFILTRINEEYEQAGDVRAGRHPRHRPHRTARHLRRADPLPGLHRPRRRPGHRREDPVHRPRRGHHHRRHHHPRRARPAPWSPCSAGPTGGSPARPPGCSASPRSPPERPTTHPPRPAASGPRPAGDSDSATGALSSPSVVKSGEMKRFGRISVRSS